MDELERQQWAALGHRFAMQLVLGKLLGKSLSADKLARLEAECLADADKMPLELVEAGGGISAHEFHLALDQLFESARRAASTS